MRGGALAGLTVLAALVVLGTATATWVTITVPGAVVEDVVLPADVRGVTGAEDAPASVLAAATGFLAVPALALIGVADRAPVRLVGTVVRGAVTLLGAATSVLAAFALTVQFSFGTTLLGFPGAEEPRWTAAGGLFAVAALIVLGLTMLSWRVPRTAAIAEASRYTVEAIRGETTPAPVAPTPHEEVDEWDLAVAPYRDAARPAPAAEGEQ